MIRKMEKLTKLGDPLQRLIEYIDWAISEGPLNEAFSNEDKNISKNLTNNFFFVYCNRLRERFL